MATQRTRICPQHKWNGKKVRELCIVSVIYKIVHIKRCILRTFSRSHLCWVRPLVRWDELLSLLANNFLVDDRND